MEDLEKQLLSAIRSSGFPSELEAWRVLAAHGWRPESSFYYLDLDENKGREFDLWAYNMFVGDFDRFHFCLWIVIIVEVKKSDDPTVVFATPFSEFDLRGWSIQHWSANLEDWMLPTDDLERRKPGTSESLFGRTASRPLKKGGDTNFLQSAILSACKASVHRRKEYVPEEEAPGNVFIELILPTVIHDGPLYRCSKVTDGDFVLDKIDYIPYTQNYISKAYEENSFQCDVVTLEALPKHLKALNAWGNSLVNIFKDNVRKKLDEEREI